MPVKRVVKYGESILRRKTKPVNFASIQKDLPHILKNMWDTCFALKGAGLAANQMGLSLRLAVIVINDNEQEKRFVIINPEIVKKSRSVTEPEGCLSLPGLYANVKRFSKLKINALNEKGLPVEINAEGLLAKALQHEIDHLNGKLYIDRLPLVAKIKIKSRIKKLKPHWQKIDESKGIFYEGPVFGDT